MSKRLLSLILALLLAFTVPGCTAPEGEPEDSEPSSETVTDGAESGTVTILTYSNFGTGDSASFFWQFESFAAYVHSDIKLEVIDINVDDQAELDALCTQLKTEIMAGKGPDIYILPTTNYTFTDSKGNTVFQESFFGDINEAMYNNLFLPLDSYLPDSEYIKMENYPEEVMAAGRTAEGQVIMPLAYTYDLFLLDKAKMKDPELSYNSFDELLSCGDTNLLGTLMASRYSWFRSLWGDIADYESGNLLITEESILEMLKKTDGSKLPYSHSSDRIALDYYYEDFFGIEPPSFSLCNSTLQKWYENMDSVYPAYIPNNDNGITAFVPLFAAINANSKHPEKAFRILELFFSEEVLTQKAYGNYNSSINTSFMQNFTTATIWAPPISVDITTLPRKEMQDFVTDMNSKINRVRFDSDLESLLQDVTSVSYIFDDTEGDPEPLIKEHIHKIHTEMQMEMAE